MNFLASVLMAMLDASCLASIPAATIRWKAHFFVGPARRRATVDRAHAAAVLDLIYGTGPKAQASEFRQEAKDYLKSSGSSKRAAFSKRDQAEVSVAPLANDELHAIASAIADRVKFKFHVFPFRSLPQWVQDKAVRQGYQPNDVSAAVH